MDLGLQGKHAIVTGGSRGIGKAIARELAREGVDVAIVARGREALEATARELGAETNRRILPLAADVTSKEQVDRMVAEAAQQLGGLHILVNSGSSPGGSTTATGPIDTVVDEDLIQDFNVKYVGALRCCRAVIPFMKQAGWGRIVNISGANARNAGNLSGGARNASLVHLTKTLAVQMGRHGITVNCIHPGTTRTERTPSLLAARAAQLGVTPEAAERQDFSPDSPRGNAICRMVDASEVAFVTVFLASDKAWAVSGELVAATGGAGRTVHYWYSVSMERLLSGPSDGGPATRGGASTIGAVSWNRWYQVATEALKPAAGPVVRPAIDSPSQNLRADGLVKHQRPNLDALARRSVSRRLRVIKSAVRREARRARAR